MEILRLTDTPLQTAVKNAANALAAGELIIYPTDTVYGIGADALNPRAVQHIADIKGRSAKHPFLIVLPDIKSIEKYAVLNDTARALAEKFLPGPLSLVLPAKSTLPASLTFNGTIGIRIPDNEFCLALALRFGKPYITTSANRHGRENPRTVHAAIEQFGHTAPDFTVIVDDGERAKGLPSTTVLCITDTPQILRIGALSREQLGL